LLVVRNDDSAKRTVAAQNHVASTLALKHEASPRQGSANFAPGEVGGQFGHGVFRLLTTQRG